MTFPPLRLLQFRESRFGCPLNARVISAEELGTMSKNNLGVITLVTLSYLDNLLLVVRSIKLEQQMKMLCVRKF